MPRSVPETLSLIRSLPRVSGDRRLYLWKIDPADTRPSLLRLIADHIGGVCLELNRLSAGHVDDCLECEDVGCPFYFLHQPLDAIDLSGQAPGRGTASQKISWRALTAVETYLRVQRKTMLRGFLIDYEWPGDSADWQAGLAASQRELSAIYASASPVQHWDGAYYPNDRHVPDVSLSSSACFECYWCNDLRVVEGQFSAVRARAGQRAIVPIVCIGGGTRGHPDTGGPLWMNYPEISEDDSRAYGAILAKYDVREAALYLHTLPPVHGRKDIPIFGDQSRGRAWHFDPYDDSADYERFWRHLRAFLSGWRG